MARITFGLRTIAGQITVLTILSVAAAFLVSIGAALLLFRATRDSNERPPRLPDFVVIAELAVRASSDQEINNLVTRANQIGIPIRRARGQFGTQILATVRSDAAASDQDQWLPSSLRGRFHTDAGGRAVIQLHTNDVLVFDTAPRGRPPVPGFIAIPLLYALAILAFCILGLSIYAIRFITSPLSSFALAADAIGRSSEADRDIPERGPREITRVARALNAMRHRIRKLLAERTTMLTALSHDLRTPLTRLKLRCEKLVGDDIVEASANLMLLDIERMEQMLAETLAYLRDESQSEALVAVDLASLIQTICAQETDLGGHIQYIGPPKLVYRCKPSSITRALCNLTDNAAKHGTATRVCLEQIDGGVIQMDVIDNGPGIPFSERRRVFDPFFKRDWSRGSGGEGFGLGLSIVKQIIESHGGSIELLDSQPHGLDVRIRLPKVIEPSNTLAVTEL